MLAAIEQSAGELFRTLPDLAWLADGDNLSVGRHRELLAGGACWVAEREDGELLAFLSAEIAGDAMHFWEVSVRLDCHRRGIGRALLAAAMLFARAAGLAAITLSTFRGVAWNEPMYRELGFQTLERRQCNARLAAILDREISAGLPADRRCAMRLSLSADEAP